MVIPHVGQLLPKERQTLELIYPNSNLDSEAYELGSHGNWVTFSMPPFPHLRIKIVKKVLGSVTGKESVSVFTIVLPH